MKAAKDREEEYSDPARKDSILGRAETRLELWEEHLKEPAIALDNALKCLENPCQDYFLKRAAGGGVEPGVARPLCDKGNAQGVCADWFAPLGSEATVRVSTPCSEV